ncbi:MAG: IS30 family transposase, partial [Gammaproteobacteria bacterium]|nr:IS30 family transposase [Gammaproteobacteria bacterium]
MTPEKWQQAEACLREGWSPEQVSGRFLLEGEEMASHEWICRHVRRDRKAGGDLYPCLRRRGRKPNWRGGRHSGRDLIPGRVDIAERPAEVEQKSRIGDWELDTIIGARH